MRYKKIMTLTFKSYADLSADIASNIMRVPRDVDLIVGVPRSGMIPAYILGQFLNLPVISLSEFVAGVPPTASSTRQLNAPVHGKILLVDDSVDTGAAMARAVEAAAKLIPPERIRSLAIYYSHGKHRDIGLVLAEQPRVFQWNYRNHSIAQRSCYDLDGVLCVDPPESENDDGPRYIEFIRTAKPLYIPKYPILTIVTSRLEKYRPQTEDWLRAHGVRYKTLRMLDLPSKEERQRLKAHVPFKADVYSYDRDAVLFIESDPAQAAAIAAATAKPVICCGDDSFHAGGRNASGAGGSGSRSNRLNFTHPFKR